MSRMVFLFSSFDVKSFVTDRHPIPTVCNAGKMQAVSAFGSPLCSRLLDGAVGAPHLVYRMNCRIKE